MVHNGARHAQRQCSPSPSSFSPYFVPLDTSRVIHTKGKAMLSMPLVSGQCPGPVAVSKIEPSDSAILGNGHTHYVGVSSEFSSLKGDQIEAAGNAIINKR